jgi:hypothetical protein
MAAPALADYQWWFGFNDVGKLFGINTEVDLVNIEGLEGLSITSGTRDLPREDGAVPGLHLVQRKMPVFQLEPVGDVEYYDCQTFFKASRDTEGELHWKMPDRDQRFVRARVIGRSHFLDGLMVGRIPMTVGFEVADPRMYGTNLHIEPLGIYNPSGGGLDWEVDWEVDWSDPGSGADQLAHNAGNTRAFPIIKFFGPTAGTVTGVTMANLTTGVNFESTTDITTGQILTVDMDARMRGTGSRIIDLSGASRYGDWVLPRDTFYLQPGDNILRFTITGTSTDATASVSWRDTYY